MVNTSSTIYNLIKVQPFLRKMVLLAQTVEERPPGLFYLYIFYVRIFGDMSRVRSRREKMFGGDSLSHLILAARWFFFFVKTKS